MDLDEKRQAKNLAEQSFREKVIQASARWPRPPGPDFQYGTAGFRMKAILLDSVVFRVGLLAALRSRKCNGQTIGVMITASHNPPADNGIKLVDPMGEMLEASWEPYATFLANARSDNELVDLYQQFALTLDVDTSIEPRVVFARDTRASGPRLVSALINALSVTETAHHNQGLLTTPQLHYITRCINTIGTNRPYGDPSEAGYYSKMTQAFAAALQGKCMQGSLTIDCANGVGAEKSKKLWKHIHSALGDTVKISLTNTDDNLPESLNNNCGADYVKTHQTAAIPHDADISAKFCSLDGDADRLIYYYTDKNRGFRLLDGDRIAILAAMFIKDIVSRAGLNKLLNLGIVQTAYANGASTRYIEQELKLPLICTPTGVKHLHHAAATFDIGVYFEANGHGTVLFSESALDTISQHRTTDDEQSKALTILQALTQLINQAVGDAFSDLLLVEVILAHKQWTLADWDALYTDLPNRLVRIEVRDRNIFKTEDAERRLVAPAGAQARIDAEVQKYAQGRSFVRASGTEDAVRVYAEAANPEDLTQLADAVSRIVANVAK